MPYTPQSDVRDKERQEVRRSVVDGWKAYNITPDNETGIGAWSDAEIEQYLSSGHAPAHGSAGGGMGEAIDLSLYHLSSENIAALTRLCGPGMRWLGLTLKIDGCLVQASQMT
jgi:hypothetical protein